MKKSVKTTVYETGHSRNVANFEDFVSFCTGYGATYNPSQNKIKIASLNALLEDAQQAINNVHSSLAPWTIAVNERQLAYAPLSKLTTRLINALDASGDTDKEVADARTIGRKITGTRKSKKIDSPNPEDKKSISASQQSYDNRLDNFKKLKVLLSQVSVYTPNETELQVSTLETLIADMKEKNTAVVNTTVPLSKARIARDKILYKKSTGLVDVALEAKKYIKSLYGASSPEYKQVSSIRFSRPR